MDVGWKRVHLLIFFLTFWKHAVGRDSLDFESVHPRSLHFLKTYSPPEVQSSMLNASVTRNIPHEEVDSNVLRGNGTGPSTSLFSYLQFIKEGAPSGYASLSQAQSASSSSVSTSLTAPQNPSQPGSFSTLFQVQGSSASNVMAGQSVSGIGYNQYDSTSKDSTGLNTGGSIQLVSSTGGSGLSQSSFSQYVPGSSPLSYSPTVLSQSGSKTLNTSSQSSSGTLMGGLSSRLFTLTSQGSSRPQVTQGGSTSFSGLFQQSPSKSQSSPTYSHPGSLPLAGSRYPTSSQSLFSSGSQGSSSYQLAPSRPSGLAQGSSSQPGVSYVQSQGRLGQLAIGSPQYGSVSLASPQVPQNWLPSASSFSPGSQTSGTVVSQSSYSPQSAPAPSKPLSSVGRPSQVAPGLLYPSASLAAPQVPQKWLPSSFSPGSQTSGTVVSQSSYSPQSAPAPSKPLSSVGRPSQVAPGLLYPSASLAAPQVPQKWLPSSFSPGSQTSGTVVSQSSYSPQSAPAPSKPLSSVGRPSQVAPGLLYPSASLAAPQVPQKWLPSSFSPGSQTSGTVVSQSSYSPQSAPAPSKPLSSVGRPSQVAPGLLYPSASLAAPQVPQKWLPSSFSPGSQTSGTVVSQSSYSPQSAPAPSKPLSSVGRPSQVAPGLLYPSASLAAPQIPQKWLPSSFSPGSQTSGTVVSQSSYSPQSAPAPSKPLSSVGRPSQVAPGLLYPSASLAAPQVPQKWLPSSFSPGSQTSGTVVSQSSYSPQSAPAPSKPLSSVGRPSQVAPGLLYPSASLAGPQVPQNWLPSASSFSPGSQTSGTVVSQSSYSPQSAPAPSKPLSSVGLPSQVAPGLLSSASMASPPNVLCQYKAAESVNSMSQPQPFQRLQPSVSMSSPSIQTSSTVLSHGSSLFDTVKTPSSFSPSPAGGPSPLVSTQRVGSYSGSPYIAGSSAYSKLVSSLGAPSLFTSAQSSPGFATSSLQGSAGTAQTVSGRYVAPQKVGTSTFSSSLQSPVASSQYGPAPSLDAKVPVYSQAPPAGTMYQSQPSPFWQPASKAMDGSVSTSGAAVLQSSSSSQRVPAPSAVQQYTPVSPASGMFGSSPLSVSSQSASSQSSPSQHASLSPSRTGSLLTSSGYLSVQGSGSSNGSSLLTQGTFGKYTPVPSMDTRLPMFSQTKAVSSGVSLSQSKPLQSWQPSASGWHQVVQASGSAALQSGSSQSAQTSGSVSFQPASSAPVDSVAQSGQTSVSRQTSSLLGFGSRPSRLLSIASSGSVSNQMSPGLSASLKLPTGSMTPGSTAPGVSVSSQAQPLTDPVKYDATVGGQGMSSGLSSVLYSRYGSSSQSGPVSGSAGSQVSPSLFASLKLPTGSMTPGLTAPGVSVSSQAQPLTDPVKYGASVGGQGMSSGLSVLYSRYGSSSQSGPVSGSAGSQVSPSLFASLKLPTGSITRGSTVQTASGGMSSAPPQALGDTYGSSVGQGMSSGSVSSGLTSVSSSYGSSYGQNYPLSKPSQGSFSQYNAVKG
nr:mucin-12 isoform X2 [Misgurnus anguillicaudatus]